MADRFEELRIFVAVAEAGGVNAAAARLGLAKSAVSRRISALEERLGVDLLARETRRFALTPAGLAHHARAKELLESLDELDRSAADGQRARPLTVSAPLELAVHAVAPALAALAARRPDNAFHLVVDDPQADVAITIARSTGRRKIEGEIGRTAMAGYAAPAKDDGTSRPAGLRTVEVSAPPSWLPPSANRPGDAVIAVVGTLDMALAAAIAGLGVATLPDFMAADAVRSGRLVAVEDQAGGPTATIAASVVTGVDARELLLELAARLSRARA